MERVLRPAASAWTAASMICPELGWLTHSTEIIAVKLTSAHHRQPSSQDFRYWVCPTHVAVNMRESATKSWIWFAQQHQPLDVAYYDHMGASASAQPGSINLAPSAFENPESLMRNLVHENVHIQQYLDGRITGSGVTQQMEDEAYAADQQFWDRYSAGGRPK